MDHRRGGDSLQGRYHYYRLHPLSLYELSSKPKLSDLETLLKFGGFPEPFLKQNTRHWKRWQRERQSRVIQEDLISLEHVKKTQSRELNKNIVYYSQRTPIPRFYQVSLDEVKDTEWPDAKARILSFAKLCEVLKV